MRWRTPAINAAGAPMICAISPCRTTAAGRSRRSARTSLRKQTTLPMSEGRLGNRISKSAVLVLAGDGPLTGELERLAEPLGERVRMLGRVSIDEIADVYAMADVFVFPSRYEGRPLALLEAATAGLAILASPIPENVEVVGTAAHYIDGNDLEGWTDAMQRSVKDRGFRDQLAAQTRLLDVGSDDDMISSYLRLMR